MNDDLEQIKERLWKLTQVVEDLRNQVSYFKAYTKTLETKYEELHEDIKTIKTQMHTIWSNR